MPQPELIPEPAVAAAIGSAPLEQPEVAAGPEPVHLVVVTSRGLTGGEMPSAGATLRTRFWHPRDRCWSENDFESLEHALRLFVDESGWQLLQEQGLDEPLAREWVFRARRSDFEHPTQEQLLGEIGLTPDGVEQLLKDVSPAAPDDGAAEAGPSC